VDVILRGQTLGAVNQSRFLIGEGHFLRINPTVPDGVLTLDGTGRAQDLIGKAAHVSRREMPTIEEMFAGYTAPQFTPLYI
jgi:hypothetical protein